MSTDKPQSMDTIKLDLEAIKDWLLQTTHLFAKFALILVILSSALFLSFMLHLPLYISYSLVLMIAATLFIMLIMVSIKNIIYRYLKTSVWGQIVLYLLIALISARSYLWAIGEINRIFLVDPSNLALTTTVLSATQFFRYAIMVLLGSYLIAIGLYAYVKHAAHSDATYKKTTAADHRQEVLNPYQRLGKKLLAGATFVVIVMLSLIAAGNISKYSDTMIQSFAIKIDFYSYHTCSGEDFRDIEGVLFLSASDILVAKEVGVMTWEFKKVSCQP